MRARYLLGGMTLVSGLIASSCLVSTYDEVDVLPGGNTGGVGASSGSGGTAGVAGATGGSSGAGGNAGGASGSSGTGGTGQCGSCSPPAGLSECCYDHPTKGKVCGNVVTAYGVGCLEANAPGTADSSCPTQSTHGLAGCCMPNGLCGYLDELNGLGCIPAEAFGDSAKPCSAAGASKCGEYCASSCSAPTPGTLPYYECAEACANAACKGQIEALLSSPCSPSSSCLSSGEKYYSGCLNENNQVAQCRQNVDCGQYCAMVMEGCSGATVLQYKNAATCLKACPIFTPGAFNQAANTIACRIPKVVNGLCDSAGPASPQCGGACAAYCTLYKDQCPTEFANQFKDDAGCGTWCGTKPKGAKFTWGKNASDPVNCRIEKLIEKANGATQACTQLGNISGGICN